jgi:hypothetical protein
MTGIHAVKWWQNKTLLYFLCNIHIIFLIYELERRKQIVTSMLLQRSQRPCHQNEVLYAAFFYAFVTLDQ